MKNVLRAATVIGMATFSSNVMAADVAPPAESPFSAVFEGWAGGYFLSGENGNFEPDDKSFFALGGAGRARLNLSDIIAVQIDGETDYVDGGKKSNDTYEDGVQGGLHLSLYNDSGLVGLMGAIGDVNTDNESANFWLIGAEGQMYFDQTTLYLQAGYLDSKSNDDPDDAFNNAFFVRGVGRYFLSPQTRMQAEVSGAWGDEDSDKQNMEVYGWGLRADHQLIDMLSMFVGYQGAYYDNCCDDDDDGHYVDHQVRVGISLLLGRPDLLSVDRTGPTLDLPWVSHWVAAGSNLD
ncbi:MAG TPA: hypothetical protein VM144_16805 [Aestuariivirga sp.]|nr:hypothetical protein [Aestuariivirga sp.]